VPAVFSHAVAGLGIGAVFYRPGVPNRVWIAGAICAALPDIDVIGFSLGVRYGDFWGLRGFRFSFVFAPMIAPLILIFSPQGARGMSRPLLCLSSSARAASHS